MVIATSRIVLSLRGNASLKGKRKVVRRVLDRVRHRFNAAVAEVDDMDAHQRAVIGVAVVSNDARHASSMLDTIVAFVAESTDAPIFERKTELIHVGEGAHMSVEVGVGADWDLDQEEAMLEEGTDDD